MKVKLAIVAIIVLYMLDIAFWGFAIYCAVKLARLAWGV